jgi:hypothetical protein
MRRVIVRPRWSEVDTVNRRDWDTVEAALSDGCSYGAPWPGLSGGDQVLGRFKALITAFYDQKADVTFLVAANNKAAFELHIAETYGAPRDSIRHLSGNRYAD